ncbi:hypothetical protein YA0002_12345 [Pseudomonas cichorii]|uniref:FlxA-like family protein n=1 Tax=Pseudomonas cichorii TaxID=36746 RepID=UPI0018E5D191|nr:hypothetical protein [Pseudomonas cichorii]MBI6853558.1 hypothetical protein [Pseudomonas cichorii]
MTTINTSSLSAYSSALTLTVKNKDADTATTDSTQKTTGVSVSLEGAKVGGGAAPAGGAGGSSTADDTIEKIKEQIKQAQKQLVQQQAQLAAAQNSKGSEEEKAARILAIQGQIAQTSSTIQTLQGTLLQLTTSGGVNTTA